MTEENETFPIRIGKILNGLIEKQLSQIKEATYNCVEPTPAEAGEIIAKKFLKQI